ncbi:MAG: DUF4097 family beta strand repeat-containing protein [Cyclobacteriaceae bacterium]|jgi:hypothetical protein|nr:DUF4097 domain-containing protein [Flammeovirgaceae bacterium]
MKQCVLILLLIPTLVLAQNDKDRDFHLDKEFNVNLGGQVRLRCSDADVVVVGSSRSTAHVKIDRLVTTRGWVWSDETFSVDISNEDGNLDIRERANGSVSMAFGSYQERYTIRLELPLGMSLSVDGDDGNYQISSLHGAIRLDLDDADVLLEKCQGNSFSFRLDDGDVQMDEGRGSLTVDGDDADIRIRNARFASMDVNIDDGDFVVETSLADAGRYTINLQDGLVSLTVTSGGGRFDIRHDDARVTTEGNFNVINRTETRTEVSTTNGSAEVRIQADDARVKLVRI